MDLALEALRNWRRKRQFFQEEEERKRKDVNINLNISVDGKATDDKNTVIPFPSA